MVKFVQILLSIASTQQGPMFSNLFINKRLAAILFLGVASGLPLALTSSTLQAWFTEVHIPLMTIGALSLIGIPYTLKFLWAPLMDHYGIGSLGKRRGWILCAQLGLVITLLILANMNPTTSAAEMGVVALAVAFLSASQDIAIDAYRTDILVPDERGLGVSYFVFAYRVAFLFSGGLALVFADYLGWRLTYILMAALMLLLMMPTYFAPPPQESPKTATHFYDTAKAALVDLLSRDRIVLLLLFVFLYKIGDALALSLMTNFLLHGLQFTLTQVGLAYKLMSFLGTIIGCFVGGALLLRWDLFKALLVFGLAQTASTLLFAALAIVGKQFFFMAFAIFVENFCSGLSTAALLAFMMSICNHQYSASQFAVLTAIMALGRVFLGPLAALMVEHLGWVQFYLWSFALSFPGIVVLFSIKNKVMTYAQAVVE